jgi:hypothetical protein
MKEITNRKIYREDGFSYWIERKNQKYYYDLLTDIAQSINLIFPEDEVYNDYPELTENLENQLNPKYKELFNNLIRALTLLNHPYRVLENGFYLAAKEDVILSGRLLQPMVLPKSLLRSRTKKIYLQLKEEFDYGGFTARQASYNLQIPISTMKRNLTALQNCGMLTRIGGNKQSGYIYCID